VIDLNELNQPRKLVYKCKGNTYVKEVPKINIKKAVKGQVLGSSEQADILIQHPGIAPKHASIYKDISSTVYISRLEGDVTIKRAIAIGPENEPIYQAFPVGNDPVQLDIGDIIVASDLEITLLGELPENQT